MSSLLDSLKEQITPDVIRGLTSSLGESGDSVQKGLLAGATAMLATLASKAQEPGFLSQIMNLISSFTTRGASAMGAAAGRNIHCDWHVAGRHEPIEHAFW
jgi:OmpA-OmpF porin, OOP family